MSAIRAGEIVIEIDHASNSGEYSSGNCQVLFFPAQTLLSSSNGALRSKIISGRSGPGAPPTFAKIISIPGQRVHVDPKTGMGRITDPLADKENAQLLEKVIDAVKNNPRTVSPGVSGPIPAVEKKLDPEGVNNWLFWMARLVENGYAQVVAGDLKKAAEYRKAGNIRAPSTHPRWTNAEFGSAYLPKPEAVAS